jgi:hypothetical protein
LLSDFGRYHGYGPRGIRHGCKWLCQIDCGFFADLIEQSEMAMRTARLEKQYEKTLSDSARLLDGERDRLRRMEHLFLQFENEALRLQLEESNGHLLGFSRADSEACIQLQDACQEIDRLESEAQTSLNEISRLKVGPRSL